MSMTSKAVLLGSLMVSTGIVGYVHIKQQSDRDKLHEGVLRDIERQQKKKTENIYQLQKQKELTKELQKSLHENSS